MKLSEAVAYVRSATVPASDIDAKDQAEKSLRGAYRHARQHNHRSLKVAVPTDSGLSRSGLMEYHFRIVAAPKHSAEGNGRLLREGMLEFVGMKDPRDRYEP